MSYHHVLNHDETMVVKQSSVGVTGSVLPLPNRENMTRYDVSHLDTEAVCNDGSSGVYYHRIGTPLNATRQVL